METLAPINVGSSRIVGNPETEIGLVANFRVARFSSKWIASERSLLPLLARPRFWRANSAATRCLQS